MNNLLLDLMNGFAVQVCKGRMKGLDGQKKCSGSYC